MQGGNSTNYISPISFFWSSAIFYASLPDFWYRGSFGINETEVGAEYKSAGSAFRTHGALERCLNGFATKCYK